MPVSFQNNIVLSFNGMHCQHTSVPHTFLIGKVLHAFAFKNQFFSAGYGGIIVFAQIVVEEALINIHTQMDN